MSISFFGFTIIRAGQLRELRVKAASAQASAQALAPSPAQAPAQALAPSPAQASAQALAPSAAQASAQASTHASAQALAPPPGTGSIQMSIPEPGEGERDDLGGKPSAAVHEVIRLADGLLDLTGNGTSPDEQQASSVLRWVDARATSLLAACEVVRVEETGSFDPSRHQAVATRTPPSPELAEQIAETIRPGYAWRGAMLRPQQVTVYAPADQPPGD